MSSNTTVRCPDVTVPLTGMSGNLLLVIGLVQRELKRSGHADLVPEFTAEATSGDWGHCVSVVSAWVNVS